MQRVPEPLGEPLEREFSVAHLGTGVLRHRGHARTQLGAYPRFLRLG